MTRATHVRVKLRNPVEDGWRPLLHRLYGDAEVALDAPEVLTVPRSAVIQTGPEAVVYVEHEDGNYARQAVKIGRRGNALVEVLSGVEEDDKVVTNGNLLIDGQAEMNRSFSARPLIPMQHGACHQRTTQGRRIFRQGRRRHCCRTKTISPPSTKPAPKRCQRRRRSPPRSRAMARYGLSARDVLDTVEIAIGGKNVNVTIEGRERLPIQVRIERSERDDIEELGRILSSPIAQA